MTSGGVYAPRVTRWFNTAGFCTQGDHYMLPPARRVPHVRTLRWTESLLHRPHAKAGGQDHLPHRPRRRPDRERQVCGGRRVDDRGGQPHHPRPRGPWTGGVGRALELAPECRARLATGPPAAAEWPAADPGQRITAAMTEWARVCPRPPRSLRRRVRRSPRGSLRGHDAPAPGGLPRSPPALPLGPRAHRAARHEGLPLRRRRPRPAQHPQSLQHRRGLRHSALLHRGGRDGALCAAHGRHGASVRARRDRQGDGADRRSAVAGERARRRGYGRAPRSTNRCL